MKLLGKLMERNGLPFNREDIYLECKLCDNSHRRYYLFSNSHLNKEDHVQWIRRHLHRKDVFKTNHIHLVYDLSSALEIETMKLKEKK